MSLRVLLADESTTIKKVMQLALQDFAVEVKAVHSGLDVVEVARQFQPDIIFADILLQKKNGYEVSADLKNDPELSSIPTVLMWSSFMDLDEAQAAQSRADSRLEKPFDVENLRQVVLGLVPRTQSQKLAPYLKFPEAIATPLKEEAQSAQAKGAPASFGAPVATPGAVKPTPPPAPTRVAPPPPPPPAPAAKTAAPAAPTPPPAAPRPAPPPPPSSSTAATPKPHPMTPPGRHMPPPPTPAAPQPPPPAGAPKGAQPPARPQAPQSPPLPPSTPASTQKSNWDMESFDDIADFAEPGAPSNQEAEIGPEVEPEFLTMEPAPQFNAPPTATQETTVDEDSVVDFVLESAESDDDEDASAFKMTTLQATRSQVTSSTAATPPKASSQQKPAPATAKAGAPKRPQSDMSGTGDDAEEPWSHQDLSRFKVELSPVEVEGEEFALTVDPDQNDVEARTVVPQMNSPRTNQRTEAPQAPKERLADRIAEHKAAALASEQQPIDMPIELELGPELTNAPEIELSEFSTGGYEPLETIEMIENVETHDSGSASGHLSLDGDLGNGPIPQLSPERLEQIVRAQSREIIESVVRKIVPDIASEMIRQELERLLSDRPT